MGEHRRHHEDKIRVRVEIENMYRSFGLWQRLGRLKWLRSLRYCEGFDIYFKFVYNDAQNKHHYFSTYVVQ